MAHDRFEKATLLRFGGFRKMKNAHAKTPEKKRKTSKKMGSIFSITSAEYFFIFPLTISFFLDLHFYVKKNFFTSPDFFHPPSLDVGLQERLHRGRIASPLVVHTTLVALREQLDRGEATDAVALSELRVSRRVAFRDDDVGVVRNLRGQLLPGSRHTDAVTAPRSVELDEDILGRVVDDVVVVLRGELDDASGADGNDDGDKEEDLLEHFFFGWRKGESEPLLCLSFCEGERGDDFIFFQMTMKANFETQ